MEPPCARCQIVCTFCRGVRRRDEMPTQGEPEASKLFIRVRSIVSLQLTNDMVAIKKFKDSEGKEVISTIETRSAK